jgi:hypothetical protein
MLLAVSFLAVLPLLPFDVEEHPANPTKMINPAPSNNVVRVTFIVIPYSIFGIMVLEDKSILCS